MGFPSPADDYVQSRLEVIEYLTPHPATTFYAWCDSQAMRSAGIGKGDLLVIDRSLTPAHGNVVMAVIDGERVISRLIERDGHYLLRFDDQRMREIALDDLHCQLWGVVTFTVRAHCVINGKKP